MALRTKMAPTWKDSALKGSPVGCFGGKLTLQKWESMLDTKNVIANGLQQEDGMDTEDAGNSSFYPHLY